MEAKVFKEDLGKLMLFDFLGLLLMFLEIEEMVA